MHGLALDSPIMRAGQATSFDIRRNHHRLVGSWVLHRVCLIRVPAPPLASSFRMILDRGVWLWWFRTHCRQTASYHSLISIARWSLSSPSGRCDAILSRRAAARYLAGTTAGPSLLAPVPLSCYADATASSWYIDVAARFLLSRCPSCISSAL